MVKKTTLNIVVHVNDETAIESGRVPSNDTDFVSLKVGPEISVLLFNTAQATALANAAVEAFRILSQIETDNAAKVFATSIWGNGTVTESEYDEWISNDGSDEPDANGYFECGCTPTTNCWDNQADEDDYYYDYEDQPF